MSALLTAAVVTVWVLSAYWWVLLSVVAIADGPPMEHPGERHAVALLLVIGALAGPLTYLAVRIHTAVRVAR